MDNKNETPLAGELSSNHSGAVQKIAETATKMSETINDNMNNLQDQPDGGEFDQYDKNGFDSNGIHRETGTPYDKEGYDKDGFDDIGVDREGFDREGFGSDDRDREGYDREGYDKDGYDRWGFNRDGINRSTGDVYSIYGVDREGYDRNGYDKKGFDREGFNQIGRDKDGYDRDGYDYYGWNRDGKHKDTGTEFNQAGFNKDFKHKDTGTKYDPEGFDWNGLDKDHYDREGFKWGKGYDREGYDKEGFNSQGFNRDGINKETGTKFNRYGFARGGRHKDTGDYYNLDGFNMNGRDRDGYDKYGFDEKGMNRETGSELDPDGYDMKGLRVERKEGAVKSYLFDRRGFRHTREEAYSSKYKYNSDGFDKDGFDAGGRDEDGFDRSGFSVEGYNREGLDKDGYTREYNAKFNKYGIDENGYQKNGEIDPDVEFAIDFAKSGIRDQSKFASERAMDEKEVRGRIEAARKKCPNIDEVVSGQLQTGNKMRMAAIANDCRKFIDGSLDLNDFWKKHPKLSISDLLTHSFISDTGERKRFADRTIEKIALDSDNIENNAQIFGASRYDISAAIKGAEDFKKIYARFDIDGSPEQTQQKRENTKKIYGTIKYLSKYKNRNIDSLLGSRQSSDGGQTWVEFTGAAIGEAMDALKKDKRLVCVQTVKDYIINQAKS